MRLAVAALLLAALPASADDVDGGTAFADPIYASCPVADAPVEVDGGSFLLSPARAARDACLLASCETDREATPPVSANGMLVALALGLLGLLVGVAGAWFIRGAVDGR